MDGRKQSQCQSEKAEEDQPRLGLPPGEARRMDGVEITEFPSGRALPPSEHCSVSADRSKMPNIRLL
jgi:hypothetical protein